MNKKPIKLLRLITWPRIINGLTISRILMGLPILLALKNGNNGIFILIIIIGALTDYFDGYFARKYNHHSVLTDHGSRIKV